MFGELLDFAGWTDEDVRQWRDSPWFQQAKSLFEEWSLRKAVDDSVAHARKSAAHDPALAVDILKGRAYLSQSKLKPPEKIRAGKKVDLKEALRREHERLKQMDKEVGDA